MPVSPTHQPAWLERVLEDHVQLKESLAELRVFLTTPRPEIDEKGSHTWAASCALRLVELHDLLFRHFRFEEREGMLRDLARLHPRALSKVEAVEKEHVEILKGLRSIIADVLEYSEGRPPEDDRIRKRIRAVMEQLDAHEQAEVDLIQRVAYRDVGAGD